MLAPFEWLIHQYHSNHRAPAGFRRPDDFRDQTGEDRDKKRHLKGDMPGLGVDTDDLLPRLRRLPGELLFELGVAHHLGVMFQDLGDLLLLSPGKHLRSSVTCASMGRTL